MKLLITISTTVLIAGCSTVPINVPVKNDHTVDVKVTKQELVSVQWQAPHQAGDLQRNLSQAFDIPELKQLIQTALKNNPSLEQSAIKVKEQGLLTRQYRAARLPSVSLDGSGSHAGENSSTTAKDYQIGFSSQWEIDLWGKLADQALSSALEEKATQADYQAARNSLASELARYWVSLAAQKQILQLEQKRLVNLRKIEHTETLNFQSGLSTNDVSQLASARSSIATTQSGIAERQETLKETQRAFNVLLGKTPTAELKTPSRLPKINQPMASVPSVVMGARPDLQAAFTRIQAADADIRVAYKDLLPSINLSPTLSQTGSGLSNLLSGNVAWQLLASLTTTLFDGGSSKLTVTQKQYAAQTAALSYRETLLTALTEVEDALSLESSYQKQIVFLNQVIKQGNVSLNYYRTQYAQGLGEFDDSLTAEQSTIDNQVNLLEIQRSQLENRIELILALGMGI
ncbi:TolC family protein [Leucothrix sargassi]|nr:TolC family protein [Leucothrix sargassi]